MAQIKSSEFTYDNLHEELQVAFDDATEDDSAEMATVALRVFRRALLNRAVEVLRARAIDTARWFVLAADALAEPSEPNPPEPFFGVAQTVYNEGTQPPDPDWYIAQLGADAAMHKMDEAGDS